MNKSHLWPADAPESSSERAMQLLDAFQAGLRKVVQDIEDVEDVEDVVVAGGDGLERLAAFLGTWYGGDWRLLWAFRTAAEGGAVDPEAAEAISRWRAEERMLLDRLVEATGAANPGVLGDRVRVIVYGGGIAAALDDGHADTAAQTVRRLLRKLWQEQERAPVAVAPLPCSASGDPHRPRAPRVATSIGCATLPV